MTKTTESLNNQHNPVPQVHSALRAPDQFRRQVERLVGRRDEKRKRHGTLTKKLDEIGRYLTVADDVTDALQKLSGQLFEELLGVLEQKLTIAIQDVLEQPIEFRATADFKRGAAVVEFSVMRDGHEEDIQRGQGGSVQNVLSVCLRMFALATLDQSEHRSFLVLDEQDCWLRPELVPRLVSIVHQAARELNFQVLMISHHDIGLFEKYADRIYRFEPAGSQVEVREVSALPGTADVE